MCASPRVRETRDAGTNLPDPEVNLPSSLDSASKYSLSLQKTDDPPSAGLQSTGTCAASDCGKGAILKESPSHCAGVGCIETQCNDARGIRGACIASGTVAKAIPPKFCIVRTCEQNKCSDSCDECLTSDCGAGSGFWTTPPSFWHHDRVRAGRMLLVRRHLRGQRLRRGFCAEVVLVALDARSYSG